MCALAASGTDTDGLGDAVADPDEDADPDGDTDAEPDDPLGVGSESPVHPASTTPQATKTAADLTAYLDLTAYRTCNRPWRNP